MVTAGPPDARFPTRRAPDEASLLAWARDEPQPQPKDRRRPAVFRLQADLVSHTLTDEKEKKHRSLTASSGW